MQTQESQRYYTFSNPRPVHPGQKFTEKSLTVPCLSATVRDILMRTSNGEIVKSPPKSYDQDNDMKHTVKMYVTDLTEIDRNQREISRLEAQCKKEEQEYLQAEKERLEALKSPPLPEATQSPVTT